jgi:hypothetical protein
MTTFTVDSKNTITARRNPCPFPIFRTIILGRQRTMKEFNVLYLQSSFSRNPNP